MKILFILAAMLFIAAPAHANHHHARHASLQCRGMSLKGCKELIYENALAGAHAIRFTEASLAKYKRRMLVPLTQSESVVIDPKLPIEYRWTMPVTHSFITVLGRKFYRRFHHPIRVNSAVRTAEYQRRLRRTNLNAIGISGTTASLHLTARAVDIAKKGYSPAEVRWLHSELIGYQNAGIIRYQNERMSQSVYHVVVFKPVRHESNVRN